MCMRSRREDLCECHQPGPHRHRVAIKGTQVYYLAMVDTSHDLFAPTECADGHTATNRLRQADQVRFHRIEFRNTSGCYRYTRLDFIEDQQHPVPASYIT